MSGLGHLEYDVLCMSGGSLATCRACVVALCLVAAVARNDFGREPQLIWAVTRWNERVAKLWQLRDPLRLALYPAHTS